MVVESLGKSADSCVVEKLPGTEVDRPDTVVEVDVLLAAAVPE